jgi:BirA family biotin operon repressor/biotin-[acetyl-CoA-carboxylase] ligase
MNKKTLTNELSGLILGKLRFHESIGSTNDEALVWAAEGAPDLSIVVADEQTQGRGRLDRKWITPKGTALAFSLILHPSAALRLHLSRTVGLAALSITDSLLSLGLTAQIKWPNDILLNGKKVAGILIETVWSGDDTDSLVIGIGINITKDAIPPADLLKFPATSIEEELKKNISRESLLHDILEAFIKRLPQIGSDEMIRTWEKKLAFQGKRVQALDGNNRALTGKLMGLDSDGSLRLRDEYGNPVTVRFGDISLRPAT